MKLSLLVLLSVIVACNTAAVKKGERDLTVTAIDYLTRNGYYDTPDGSVSSLNSEKSVRDAIRSLQEFAGIPVTGNVDAKTQELMKQPRCGMPDYNKQMKTKRKRRYTLQGSKWALDKMTLTWRLKNDNNDGLSRRQVEDTLHKAFSKWQEVTNMKFIKLQREAQEEADIEVEFVTHYHGDPYPFDGHGGTLAHAFYPHNNKGLSGDVHFDDDEVFSLGNNEGRNLLFVATHEIGHSIGLEHSSVQESIMYPWYSPLKENDLDLHEDDIMGIQTLYGSKAEPRPTEPVVPTVISKPTTTTKSVKYIPGCTGEFKSVFLDQDTKKTYIINSDKVYTLDANLKLEKEPKELRNMFLGLDSVDAVYTKPNGDIIFFKDTRYFIYESVSNPRIKDEGNIHTKFRGLPPTVQRIDAAFIWSGNGKTYLFSGDQYYRYDENYHTIDSNYPRSIVSAWKGVPANVDSVFEWSNGATYFFKGLNYYRLNNQHVKVEFHYPKSIGEIWTKCTAQLTGSKFTNGAHTTSINSISMIIFSLASILFAILQ